MQDFLASHPQWNRKKLITASISLFLIENQKSIKLDTYKDCSQTYLHSLCTIPKQDYQN